MLGFHRNTFLKRLLVMRFSAMGDVAMTVPVLYALATQHPDLRITMMTRTRFAALFEWLPANVQVRKVDFEENDGMIALAKVYRGLKDDHFDAVVDLHDVLRTQYIRSFFAVSGTRVVVVDKGRKEKNDLIGHGQTHEALRPMVERYADAFRSLGLEIDLSKKMQVNLRGESFTTVRAVAGRKQEGERWVGVAPFAAHVQKIYPLDHMQKVVEQLAAEGCKVFLFGAGSEEMAVLTAWEGVNVVCVCNKLGGLHNEMLLMSQLDLMVSMDSANMHIASLVGTPVLSIWGATHPKAGFVGTTQEADGIVQLDLPCRPCSIYGKTPCQFGDIRCLDIAPETVVQKALKMLS